MILRLKHEAFFLAIDIAAFASPDQFKDRVDDFIDHLKQSIPEPGVSEVLLPGESAFRTEQERRATGIPLPTIVLTELDSIARSLGINDRLLKIHQNRI